MHQSPIGHGPPRGGRHGDQAAVHQALAADGSRPPEPAQCQREAKEHYTQEEEEETSARILGATQELGQERCWTVASVASVESLAP